MEAISKAQIKLVRSLQVKKFRDEYGLFVAEGAKCVEELCKGFRLEYLIQSADYALPAIASAHILSASDQQIEQMSGLRTPQGVIGVFRKPSGVSIQDSEFSIQDSGFRSQDSGFSIQESGFRSLDSGIVLALDGIQDPGNLGTIIRTCDWFGIRDIVCSAETADCFNPKVVQATMGALARVHIHYVDLPAWLGSLREQRPETAVYGTLLDGRNMYETGAIADKSRGVILMGNEGKGISPAVRAFITHPLYIPSYPKNVETSESLNVSIATAIVLAEFRRKE